MAKLLGRSQITINTLQDAYNISQSVNEYIFSSTNTGVITDAVSISSVLSVTQGNKSVQFTIGSISKPTGFSAINIDNTTKTVTLSVSANTANLADNGIILIPVIIDGITYNQSFTWSKVKKGEQGNAGIDGYSINASRLSYIVSTDKDGKIHTAVTTSTSINVFKGSVSVVPTIGTLPNVPGCTLSKSGATITIIFNIGTSLAENGSINIPFLADGKNFSISFAYAKARTGANGATGAAGIDANMLNWVKDWNSNKTVIGSESVITPKILAGVKNSNGTITGVAIGKFPLSTYNSSGSIVTETINGIFSFNNGYCTFSVDSSGNAQIGRDKQSIKYNASTGKIEFGQDVSLNWVNAINTAKNDAISTAAADASNKVSAIQIGGRNLVQSTSFKLYDSKIIEVRGAWATIVTDAINLITGHSSLKITSLKQGVSGSADLMINTLKPDRQGNHNVVISFWAKASIANTKMYWRWGYGVYTTPLVLGTGWQKFEFRLDATSAHSWALHPYFDGIQSVWISDLMVEYGTKASNWQPAIEDLQSEINQASTQKIRYIRDWLNGSSANTSNHWVQVKALDYSGNNIALNKSVSGNSSDKRITNGNTDTNVYASTGVGLHHVIVDLGAAYDIEKVQVWHYYADARTSNATKTEVSLDGINWFTIFDSAKEGKYKESATGRTYLVKTYDRTKDFENSVTKGSRYYAGKFTFNHATPHVTSLGFDTKIPFNDGQMWLLEISGFGFGTHQPLKMELMYYTGGGNFGNFGYTCSSALDVTKVRLGAKGGFVCVELNFATAVSYLNLDVQIVATRFDASREVADNWMLRATAFDVSYTNIVEVPRKSTIQDVAAANALKAANEAKTAGVNAQAVADAITKKSNDEKWATKLTYIDSTGIFTGTLSANTVNAIKINAVQITAGTIDAARINVAALKSELITAGNINALTLNVVRGKIGGWNIDSDSIYIGAKNNTSTALTATSGAMTIGSNGIRGFKWRLDSSGAGAVAGGNISWDATGNVSFAPSVSLNWVNAINNVSIGGRNLIKIEKLGGTIDAGRFGDWTGRMKTITSTSWRIQGFSEYFSGHYSVSFYAKANVAGKIIFDICDSNLIALDITTSWTFYKLENLYVSNYLGSPYYGFIDLVLTAGSQITNLFLSNFKVEFGTKCTGYSPAPEDVQDDINDVQTVADKTITALGGSSYPKLTQINSSGIYTGTLTATQINAVNIDAGSIKTGTISADRIASGSINSTKLEANSIKTNIINTDYINGLTCTFIRGKIGGWNIGTDNITIGSLNVVGQTPIQIRSTSSGSGQIYLGQYRPYGITMSWFQNQNAGHIVLGQVMANGTTPKTGFVGIQMMAWDNTEYFCLSANYTKDGSKEVYNRIAGWAFDNTRIWKNNVSLGADGSIYNGNLWKLNNDGSGQIANGNISWNAAGAITFSSAVSLNWRNEVNKGRLYVRGTGLNHNASRVVSLNGTNVPVVGNRGLTLVVIDRNTLSVVSNTNYDVYSNNANCDALATALNALGSDKIVTLTSYDAITITANLNTAIQRCGGSDLIIGGRIPYVLIGIPGIGKGNGLLAVFGYESNDPFAELSTEITNGIPQGVNLNGRQSTYITGDGIYTGTLNASQINAGIISTDRLDASTIKGNIINTDYINGLTCTFIRGKIGGWNIGADNFNIGIPNVVGQIPLQIRSTSSGSGYWYQGAFKPYGLSMLWYQNSNAGHIVFGQIAASGNSVKTGFIGLQMMAWDNTEYFCLSANYTKTGGKEVYNRIAGWAFDNTRIWKNNVSLGADGSIQNSTRWQLNNDGAGRIANGNIVWDANGNITFGSSVSLNWTKYTNDKFNEIQIGGRNYALNTSNEWSSAATLTNLPNQCFFSYAVLAESWKEGDTICVSYDYKYENLKKESPSGYIVLQGGGNVTAWTNGFTFGTIPLSSTTAVSGVITIKYSFKLTAAQATNSSFGINIRHDYFTGKAYIRNLKIEKATTYSEWSPAPEDINNKLTKITSTGIYTGTIGASQIKVDTALVVGGSTYNGSVSVRDASNAVKVTLDRNGINAVGGVIGGWTISPTQISKGSVVLGADGSITNGTKWKLNLDGSGQVANGNISWTAAGDVAITGHINATSGKIGGFTIEGNRLSNNAGNSSISFENLDGESSVCINESSATLLSLRADSTKTAISIQTYYSGAIGISIIANAGSKYAIASAGPHRFYQRYGEVWNAPGVLFSAIVKNSNTLYNQWGNGLKVSSFVRERTGFFRFKHNLGHTEYTVMATPYWDHNSNWHGNAYVRVEFIGSNEFCLRVVNADNGSHVDTCFTFCVIGRNSYY